MRILIAGDDFASRLLLQKLLAPYGEVRVAVNGKEAVEAVNTAESLGEPYGLICLDITTSEMDGPRVLEAIRRSEYARGVPPGKGVKIIMATAVAKGSALPATPRDQCDACFVKPIEQKKLLEQLKTLGLAARAA